MVQDVNASLLVCKDLIVPDDAFPIAKDNNARAKAVVDLVTLQVDRRRQIRHAWGQQRAQRCPTAGPGCIRRGRRVTAGSQAQSKVNGPGVALPSLHRCTHAYLSERLPREASTPPRLLGSINTYILTLNAEGSCLHLQCTVLKISEPPKSPPKISEPPKRMIIVKATLPQGPGGGAPIVGTLTKHRPEGPPREGRGTVEA